MPSTLHWRNSILSTQQAKYICLDLKNLYLSVPLDRYKYMRIPISMFPAWIVAQYDLLHKVVIGYIYLKMQRAVLGLPQAGILANKLLCKQLAPPGYYGCKQTPGLWKHVAWPILFTLVGDNFGMKYVNKDNVKHLIQCLKKKYKVTKDWDGNLYCGIKLNGITTTILWIFQCQDISSNNSRNTSMQSLTNHNIVHILNSHANMVAKRNNLCP